MRFRVEGNFNSPASLIEGGEGVRGREEDSTSCRKGKITLEPDKIQTIYVKPSNLYGISQIGFPPRQWPEEFNDIFEIDYPKMMEKVVISPLKGMLKAMNMDSLLKWNPAISASLEYSIDDI